MTKLSPPQCGFFYVNISAIAALASASVCSQSSHGGVVQLHAETAAELTVTDSAPSP